MNNKLKKTVLWIGLITSWLLLAWCGQEVKKDESFNKQTQNVVKENTTTDEKVVVETTNPKDVSINVSKDENGEFKFESNWTNAEISNEMKAAISDILKLDEEQWALVWTWANNTTIPNPTPVNPKAL